MSSLNIRLPRKKLAQPSGLWALKPHRYISEGIVRQAVVSGVKPNPYFRLK